MAKKVISDEMIIDSDEGLSTDSETEREVEAKAVEFIPPRKYNLRKDNKAPKVLQKIGKKEQVWLFKIPKDVDISKIKSLPVDSNETFQIGDKTYSITEEINKDKNKFQVFIPKDDDSKFENSGVEVTKYVDIVEHVQIPEINYSKVVVERQDVEKEEGLRMRHFPTGYYIKDFEEAKEPYVPSASEKKRKAEDDEEEEPKKKSKKDKKEKKEKRDKKDKKSKKDKN
ncbi:hypothetical protein CANINC_002463 [Pichia inconspicua]|uniref:DNA-directed RNA polymerase I subunit RPA34 n=1 Tax=Pichia inconspicua TaxID=52247 RepID=A0A4V4NFQ4_9ASCO|nr:hypothetical protein CANINC_002463 [[Candida] inconspicua]